ncbi:MAG: DUF2188 domain-containing protein [Gammaproteobacteria bacterium]
MGFDQKGTVAFRVSRDKNGMWSVFEQGFDKSLASFDKREDACDYAEDFAKNKAGSTVLIQDDDIESHKIF